MKIDFVKIIRDTLPTRKGTRNCRVFDLARELWSVDSKADPAAYRSVVKSWHQQALKHIQTKDFLTTWEDFCRAWPKIRHKIGDNIVKDSFDIAVKMEPPKIALELYPEHKKIQTLITLCKVLQDAVGEGNPFFLSTRNAGNLLEVQPMTISRWFLVMKVDKVVELVSKGHGGKGRGVASRYKYVGGK